MNDRTHVYTSTSCLHDLHGRCRRVCKFCNEPCMCICHWRESMSDPKNDPPPEDLVDKIKEALDEEWGK